MIFNKKITSILLILILNIAISKVYSQDEKYYFRGNFGTSSLAVPKSNDIQGVADLLITRSEGVYKFQYSVTLNNFNGNEYFSSKIAGPSAPQKEDGQLKLALSYTNPTVSSTTFVGTGINSLSISSPANNLIPPILQGLTTNPEKSNYANEQFYITFNINSDTSPVTRAQLLYIGSTNLPIEGGGANPNGSSSADTSSTSSSSSTTTTPYPSATSSNLPTPTPSSGDSSNTDTSLNPGGVETDSSQNSNNNSTTDSSDSNSLLPTLGVISLFVIGLVIMS